MTDERPAPQQSWWLALALVVGTALAYGPVRHAGVIWDDRSFIMDNALIRRADGLWRFWFSTVPVDYYPVTSTLWWFEWRLWGESPTGYHAVNVLLHAGAAVLLWRLLARLKIPGAWWAAAIFAVHPVNVESVAWIAERKNVLAMVFYLASLSCFVRSRPVTPESGSAVPTAGGRWYGLALFFFCLALLSKTVVAPMPLVLLGIVAWQQGRLTRAALRGVLPFVILSVVIGSISYWFQSHRAIGDDVVRADGFWARLAGAGWAIWFYAYKAFFPWTLRAIYPRWQIDPGQWWSYVPGLLVVAALVVLRRSGRGWGRAVFGALLYFVVMLSPVLGLLDIGFMKFSLVADHWQYFAIIGPIALLAAAIARGHQQLGMRWRRVVAAGGGAILVVLAVMTWRQCEVYRDPETFWRAVLATDDGSWAAHNNLGGFLVEQGRPDEAIAHFRRAVEIQPHYARAQYNLGAALSEKGQLDEATVHLQVAVQLRPRYIEAHNGLARTLAKKGDWDSAMQHLERSLALDPDQAEAHNNLANVLRHKRRLPEAAAEYQQALALHPDYAAAQFNLGDVLRGMGETPAAVAHYKQALESDPDLVPALERLAWVLATSPDAAARDAAQAVAMATRADAIVRGGDSEVVATLAAAYAAANRFSEAVTAAERAIRIAVAEGRPRRAEKIRAQLALYQTGVPYREQGGGR